MTAQPDPERLFRRNRILGWTTAGLASVATVGLIAGISHAATPTSSTTSSTGSSTGANNGVGTTSFGEDGSGGDDGGSAATVHTTNNANNNANLGTAPQQAAPHGGSNGS